MPLLKKKPFEKVPMPNDLQDSDKVFYCSITNEIFRNYEDFSERMFLCNSMVWTCSLTGKSNLTYSEALESEENARKNLQEFPPELKPPILYLASKTKKTSFGDMAHDVFTFSKSRYFIGENVETSFTGTNWKDSHILQVIAPSPEQCKKTRKSNGSYDDLFHPPAALFKYEIEHLDADDEDISEIMIVDHNQIRRKKGLFTQEKCKLFLKQYVEQSDKGFFAIKKSALEAFKINKLSFDQIFDGPLPEFGESKKVEKSLNGKKIRQESLHKFLTKNNGNIKTSNNNSTILEKMKKREEELQLMKQKKKEDGLAMRQKKKEENIELAKHVKDWYMPNKEDLELIDQKKLPIPTPIKSSVPEEHFGDMLMVLEFVNSFSQFLSTKDFFPGGLTLETIERALTKNEVAGPFIDLIQMFLSAIFNVQDEEASQYATNTENPSSIKQENSSELGEASKHATVASNWSKTYQGLPLGRLPLYTLTTSEILRLHLLSSGAVIKYSGARWRYQERGGYMSEDDPGLYLRVHSPEILKNLGVYNVVQLPLSEKLQILSCLINQLLTYADVRDVIDERMENSKQAKNDHKIALIGEKRRQQEFITAKSKLKKDNVGNGVDVTPELEKLEAETEKKKEANERKLQETLKALYENQVCMGRDRAMRQYLKLDSVPGLFVNFEEQNPGVCLNSIVKQNPTVANGGRKETLDYLRKTLQDSNSSDKENSPSKSPKKVNGVRDSVIQETQNCDELMLCSADINNCIVHSANRDRVKWAFYHDHDQFNELVESLNKRGIRESELQQNLKYTQEEIGKVIDATPAHVLNDQLPVKEDAKLPKKMKTRCEDVNLGYPPEMSTDEILHNALIDNLLEMEEKLFAGNLGSMSIKNREKWRSCIQSKNYKELDKTLSNENKCDESNDQEAEVYRDPGSFLSTGHNNAETEPISFHKDESLREAIQSLAIALVQIARGVDSKFLKKPLGRVYAGKKGAKSENLLGKWEQSLLAATSFSQIFLHYGTLDSCIMWGKSALLARCRICRRQHDSENMLLCDSCNCGHHLYCLKPKLKSVPPGDWYCNKCIKEKKLENPPPPVETPRKRRPIFRDEEIDEEESDDNEEQNTEDDGANDNEEVDVETNEEDDDDEEDEEMVSVKIELCKTCGSGGELITCEKCTDTYHIECVVPPLRRAPRSGWLCSSCKNNERKRSYDSSEDEVISRRSGRREEVKGDVHLRADLPLHNAALHEVLSEIMKDYNAWPFLRPVQKIEVPDYYDVITKPMDFGTIKYKLNMGEYHEDSQFMSDALLVFQNCNTYNHTDDDVYKCGVQLLRHFQKKCREVGLKLPEEMDYNDHTSRPKKKIRTK